MGEVRGEQALAWECYILELKVSGPDVLTAEECA